MQSWIDPRVEIRESSIGSKGMFATAPISVGEKVVVWNEQYTDAVGAKKAKEEGKLVMQWDENLFSVEDRGDDEAYFLNHSCDPNLWMEGRDTLVARRDITAEEELTADYILWEANENYVSTWDCHCRSLLCRSKITGRDWQLVELQERYKGHFSPLLNKRIQKRLGISSNTLAV